MGIDSKLCLVDVNEDRWWRKPWEAIAIMDDCFGNGFFLGLSEKYQGKVYFWDREVTRTFYNAELVAESFEAFIEQMVEE
ncbi:SMI1/KNR4 family protein [Planctomycetota bacterium]|nr:SMI1/KNR4 family protein [Planctomycetota bacterium]